MLGEAALDETELDEAEMVEVAELTEVEIEEVRVGMDVADEEVNKDEELVEDTLFAKEEEIGEELVPGVELEVETLDEEGEGEAVLDKVRVTVDNVKDFPVVVVVFLKVELVDVVFGCCTVCVVGGCPLDLTTRYVVEARGAVAKLYAVPAMVMAGPPTKSVLWL